MCSHDSEGEISDEDEFLLPGLILDPLEHEWVLRDVNWEASPGHPYMLCYPTNKMWRDAEGIKPILELMVERLRLLLDADDDDFFSYSSTDLVVKGFCDPIKVFIKNEPHKPEKVREGRFRLISSVSLIDQLVERFIFSQHNRLEIENFEKLASKPGMGLNDRGLKHLYNYVQNWSNRVCVDVSAWDWRVDKLDYFCDYVYRCEAHGIYKQKWIETLAIRRIRCMSLGVMLTGNGNAYAQLYPGIMKSGSYLTSSSNSHMSVILATLAGAADVMAMGDDTVADVPHKIEFGEYYKRRGKVMKIETTEVLEFCSHKWSIPPLAVPVNVSKLVCRLLNHANIVDVMVRYGNFVQNVRHIDETWKVELLQWVKDLCVKEDPSSVVVFNSYK
jgi:hypothetical protein